GAHAAPHRDGPPRQARSPPAADASLPPRRHQRGVRALRRAARRRDEGGDHAMTAVVESRAMPAAPPWRRALFALLLMAVASTLNGIFREVGPLPRWNAAWAG